MVMPAAEKPVQSTSRRSEWQTAVDAAELGRVPVDWELLDIASVATTVSSGTSRRSSRYAAYPLYGSTGIIGRCDSADYCGESILVARVGANAGKVSAVSGKYGVTDNTLVIRNNDKVDFEFLWRFLEHRNLNQMIFGSGQPLITGGQLKKLRIAIPPSVDEQKVIAGALRDAGAVITALEQLIEKKRLIKQGAMQELLSGRRRLPGFNGEWDKRSFGDVFTFLPTATNSRADLSDDGDAYYVHYGDIHTRFHGHLDFAAQKPPRIAREKCPRAALIRNGDWIMADASEDLEGVGKAVEVRGLPENEPAVAGLHTFLLREKAPVFAPGFKGHLGGAEFLRNQYLRVMTGMKVFGVSKTALRDLIIPVPSSKEQQALVEVFDDMSEDIAALETRLEKARQIKQGMMQELLTGRVRLV